MRVNVDGSCWNNGTLGQPGFRVTSLNTGGLNLSGIVTTFDLPNNATYAGLDPVTDNVPGGAVFEVSADGVDWTATAPGDAPDLTIRHVRLRNFGIVAGVSALPVRFKVRVAALDQGVLDGAAWMDSAELSPTPLTTSEFVPGTCPSDIVMRKFFDADGSGAQNDDEPTLAGWTFTLTNGTSYSQVTAASTGEVRFLDVPPGAWTFSETQPGNLGTQSTWSQTTGIDVVVVAGNGELLSIPVGNRCTCTADFDGNECTSPAAIRPAPARAPSSPRPKARPAERMLARSASAKAARAWRHRMSAAATATAARPTRAMRSRVASTRCRPAGSSTSMRPSATGRALARCIAPSPPARHLCATPRAMAARSASRGTRRACAGPGALPSASSDAQVVGRLADR